MQKETHMSVNIPEIRDMMKAGLHFGHRTSKWNPKMERYIFGVKNGVHIFDLEKTVKSLETALKMVEETVQKNGVVLFLGTKKQIRGVVEKYAKEAEMPYVVERWIGGTITNFAEIYKLVRKLDELEKRAGESDYESKYTKRERALFQEEMDNLKLMVGGVRHMKKVPDLIYIAGVRDEKTAVKEAGVKKIKSVGICDTNADPDKVTYPIAANDDAIKSVDMVTRLIAEAVKAGKNKQGKEEDKKEAVKTEKKSQQKEVKN